MGCQKSRRHRSERRPRVNKKCYGLRGEKSTRGQSGLHASFRFARLSGMWITSGYTGMREPFREVRKFFAGTVNFASFGCGAVGIESGRRREHVRKLFE